MNTDTRTIHIPPWPQHGAGEERNLLEVLRSGQWFSGMTGSDANTQTAVFEQEFAEYQGTKHSAAVANGTAALEISLRAAGIGTGDEVIVPAYTFIATASAVAQVGATPVIVDVQRSDLNIDPQCVAEAITERTKAIVPVHVGGQIADMARLTPMARDHGLAIIEDCAHAQGSVRDGTPAGRFGLAGCFSFQHAKTMSGGEGGMIVTEDDAMIERCISLRSCGRTDPGDPYLHGLLGWNYRITEWQSAILRAQLERAGAQLRQREQSAEYLREQFAGNPFFETLSPQPGTTHHNHYYFTLLLRAEARAAGVDKARILETVRAAGVPASGGYPRSIGDNPVFDHVASRRKPCPTAIDLCARAIHLPHNVLLADQNALVAVADTFTSAARSMTYGAAS